MSTTTVSSTSEFVDENVERVHPTAQTVSRPIKVPWNSQYMNNDLMLIWVDAQIDSNEDCQHAKKRLRSLVNKIRTFIDVETCLSFLHAIENENFQQQICIIVSGSLSRGLIQNITNINVVTTVAVYCFRVEFYKNDIEIDHHPKFIGSFVKLGPLLVALDAHVRSLANVMPLVLKTNTQYQRSIKDLSQENPTFIWFHLLIQAILRLPRTDAARSKMLVECDRQYDDDDIEQKKIQEFRDSYKPDQAVKWYTRDSFVYRLVNRAFRMQDIDEILTFYPFIADLHDQLRVLHDEFIELGPSDEMTVYRGQLIHIYELRKMADSVGGLLSMNSFFSTGFDRTLARRFAGESTTTSPDLVSLIYEVKIDTTVRAAPYSNIGQHTYFPTEEEFLFSVDAVFRIEEASELVDEFGQYWQIKLRLIDERNEQELTDLIDHCKSEIGGTSSLVSLASILNIMNDHVHGERYCRLLLDELPVGDKDRLVALTILGHIAQDTGRQQEAYAHYKQALDECDPTDVNQKILVSMSLNNVATMHFEAGHYDVATSEFLQILKLREAYLSTDYQMLICTYNNLSICLLMKGDRQEAIDKAEKAFTLCKKYLPENDPTRASVEGNLADVYYQSGRQKEAIFHCEIALAIQKRCMPAGHHFLITAHRNLGNKYADMGDYGQALAHLESALAIEQHQPNADSFSLAATLNGIGCVLSGQGRKEEALSYFERVLQLIPENHTLRISALQRLGVVLGQIGKIDAAYDALRQAIRLYEEQKDNSNELELASIYHAVGTIQCQCSELDNAVEIYNKALAIRQRLLPAAHPDIARLYNELGAIYLDKRDYAHALNYFKQARVIELETLPQGHLQSARTQHKIGYTLFEMGRFAEAQIEEEKALAILLEKKQLYVNHPLFNSVQRTLSVIHQNCCRTSTTGNSPPGTE